MYAVLPPVNTTKRNDGFVRDNVSSTHAPCTDGNLSSFGDFEFCRLTQQPIPIMSTETRLEKKMKAIAMGIRLKMT